MNEAQRRHSYRRYSNNGQIAAKLISSSVGNVYLEPNSTEQKVVAAQEISSIELNSQDLEGEDEQREDKRPSTWAADVWREDHPKIVGESKYQAVHLPRHVRGRKTWREPCGRGQRLQVMQLGARAALSGQTGHITICCLMRTCCLVLLKGSA